MSKSTMVELVQELEIRRNNVPLEQVEDFEMVLRLARDGEYDDYKNTMFTCGKIAAVTHLTELGFKDLADRVRAGEFDEEPDAEDRVMPSRRDSFPFRRQVI